MLWVYYASIILLLGAEFTQAWARRRGAGTCPEPGAAPKDEVERGATANVRRA
jgi:membrane protein